MTGIGVAPTLTVMMRATLIGVLLLAGACQKKAAPEPPVIAAPALRTHLPTDDDRKPSQAVTVMVNGKPQTWTPQQFAATPVIDLANKNGEAREGWPLRELTKKFVGPSARVTTVVGSGGDKIAVEAKDWQDPSKFLVLK